MFKEEKKREGWNVKAGSPQHGSSINPSQQPAWAPDSQCVYRQGFRDRGSSLPTPLEAKWRATEPNDRVSQSSGPKSSISHPLPPFVPRIWLFLPLPLNPKSLSRSHPQDPNSRSQEDDSRCQIAESLPHTPKATEAATLPLQGQSSS